MRVSVDQVCTDAFQMRYFRFGTGKAPLVILPGLSVQSVIGLARAVASAYAPLAEDFTVYVFDRRETLPPVYDIRAMAQDTAVALRDLGLRDVCLFGASQGGMIAMALAIHHPDLVKKLAVGSSAASVSSAQFQTIEHWMQLAAAQDGAALYRDFGAHIYPPAVFEEYKAALAFAGKSVTAAELSRFLTLAESIRNFSVLNDLCKIRCPVLVLGDRDDAVLGAAASEEIAAHLSPNTPKTLFLYEGYGHAAYDLAPDYKTRLLDFFLSADEK